MIVLTTIYVIVAVLLLFGAAIFVHEWGHFFVARKCGMKVEEFAIGFGKILWKREKDGILYTVRMIPAGGFVKLPQMLTSEALEGKSEEEEEEAEPLPDISPWAKIAVAVAGPIMNIVFAVVLATLIYFVGLPEMITPPVVGNLSEESAEHELGIREGDVVTKIDGEPIASWEEAYKLTALSLTNRFEVTFLRDNDEFTRVLMSTPISDKIPIRTLDLPSKYPPIVGRVLAGQAADEAGLKADDKIISLGEIPIGGQSQLIDELQKNGGKATVIVVSRGSESVRLPITPRLIEGKVMIGVQFGSGPRVYIERRPGPTPWENISEVGSLMWRTLYALFHKEQTGVGVSDLSGPVGILAMIGAMVKIDYRLALNFLVLLNVNLAIINMLPIPVLDGGHTVMGLIEGLFRRKIPVKLQEWATTGFAVALISLMVYITFHDVFERSDIFVDMFNNEVEIKAPADPTPAASE
ncbi:MAG: RIP metalloprotease RseP [Verrucomicrobiales bacterium]|nr:RIP metalloprotease RseP [Verrucomicrobiales bacterium]|tara:strand:- start:354 stop:1754 length:1401 start_codon:yes stop_codon:yes gene_type:complete